MAQSFEDLGIAPELVAGAGDMGWDAPTPLQADAIPVLRRGNNAVIHASTGAGVTGAWGLPVLDRVAALSSDDAPLALVLAPAVAEASRVAGALARAGAPAGVDVRALAPGWTSGPARILVATPATALTAVRDSTLKLDGLAILVLLGADRIHQFGDWDALRTLAESVSGADQKILVTGEMSAPIQEYIERHVRKALTMPSRPAEPETAPPGGSIRYATASEEGKVEALVSLLPGMDAGEVAVVCRTADRAARVRADLSARGVALEAGDDGRRVLVLAMPEADRRSTRADVLSCDVPFDAGTLAELHGAGGVVLVTPAELPHLRRIAARAGLRLQPQVLPAIDAGDTVEAARAAIRQAVEEADLAAYLALLQPLLEEHTAPEIAAAALYLARSAGALRAAPAAAAASPRTGLPGTSPQAGAGAPPPSTAFVRLFISVGSRDDVSPGDIVGAITGEADVAGDTVGRIDIRESHSTVEVASADADRVIRALNGRTLKGRSLRVDYDRKDRAAPGGRAAPRGGSGGTRPRGGPGGAPRGGSRGGARGGSRGGGRGGPGGKSPGGR